MKEERLKNLKSLTLLLVDDDQILLTQMETIMSIFFKNVITAQNGQEALDIYSTRTADMIITDYSMPTMDGCELCKTIRKENINIPLVIMSSYKDEETLLKAIPLSLAQYLVKPVDYAAVTSVLLHMLEYHEMHNTSISKISEEVTYDRNQKLLAAHGQIHALTKSEIAVIELFLSNKNRILTTYDIELSLDPSEQKSSPAIKSLIYRLRKKVGKNHILNVPGYGYILKTESS